VLAALDAGNLLRADEAFSSTSAFPATNTVLLEYRETASSVMNWVVSLGTQTVPFRKEPATAPGKIVRGILNFAGGASNSLPLLWQRDAGKLYLDLNRNRDLSDDPDGFFSARVARLTAYQTFTNVHLPFNTVFGPHQVLADINFYEYGPRPGCTMSMRSFWQGKVSLQGRDWQVGILPNMLNQPVSFETGRLLLRPWAERDKPFRGNGASLDTVPFSRRLFLNGHAYQLICQNGAQNGEAKPALQFTEQSVALGDLKITGRFIRRLVLTGEPYLLVLDQPAGAVRVPVGSYNEVNLQLAQGSATAFPVGSPLPPAKRITVSDKAPTLLAIGGPLTNTVIATRHGRNLRLDYQLVGAGGETYELDVLDRDYREQPQFAVYKGDRQIASGKFEFG
jgi:hypothetical protein